MLLLFLFVLLLFVVVVVVIATGISNMISVDIVEFRYYVVIIILVNLGKP